MAIADKQLRNPALRAVPFAVVVLLGACGGGHGDESSSSALVNGVEVAKFQGVWVGVDDTKATCQPTKAFGEKVAAVRVTQLRIDRTAGEIQKQAFGDAACNEPAGQLTETVEIAWSPGKVENKEHVARVLWTVKSLSSTGIEFVYSNGAKAPLDVAYRELIHVDGDALFRSHMDVWPDADGYPTRLPARAGFKWLKA